MKLTIKQQVVAASENLKAFTTTTQLRGGTIANGMDNRSAFPKFKAALLEIGIDYDLVKRNAVANSTSTNEASTPSTLSNIQLIAKHKRIIAENVRNAEISLGITPEKTEKEITEVITEFVGEPASFGQNSYAYPLNFYSGCGSYYLAFKDGRYKI